MRPRRTLVLLPALLPVLASYTGQLAQLDFQPAFGASAEELGPKVVDFAKSLLR